MYENFFQRFLVAASLIEKRFGGLMDLIIFSASFTDSLTEEEETILIRGSSQLDSNGLRFPSYLHELSYLHVHAPCSYICNNRFEPPLRIIQACKIHHQARPLCFL